MEYLFAPMEGITYSAYRRVHHSMFPGADEYYTPFIAPDSNGTFKPKFLRELTDGASSGMRVIPQLLVNSARAFLLTAEKLRDIGFDEINLNAGCPSGTVYAKHKGSGMLADLDSLDRFLDEAYSGAGRLGIRISIKTRMGVESTAEFPDILGVYLKYPVSKLIIHARDRNGMYKSEPDISGFSAAAGVCPFPVIYNGNIFSRADMERIIPESAGISGIMTGRGIAANPALIRELQGGSPLSCSEIRSFHDALLDAYLSEGLCERFTLERMKQMWYYFIHMFSDVRKEQKAVLKSGSLREYRGAASVLFSSGKFNPDGYFVQI